MRKKKICMLISALLTLSPVLFACGDQPQADPAQTVPQSSESIEKTTPPTAVLPTGPIQREYEYIRAVLKDNQLQITILNNESAGGMLSGCDKIRYDVPYSVSGLTGTYTDIFVGTMGQDIWPYVFLLTIEGTVECVPVADPIYESEYISNSSAKISFQSVGELPGISNVVSLSDGSVTDEYGGYVTVFAECADGATYDLSYPIYFVDAPEEMPASEEDSLRMLTENQEVAQFLAQGMELWNTGEINYLYGEHCCLFSLGADHEQQLSRQRLYGVGASGAVYSYNTFSEEWYPANYLAEVYSDADFFSDLFVVITDTDDPVYQQYKDTAQFISTPVVGLERPEPVLILPLKTKMQLKVELMADASGDYYAEVADRFFDETVSRKTPCLIGAALSETNSVLRVTAGWINGEEETIAVWYAKYFEGSASYKQYVSVDYELLPN